MEQVLVNLVQDLAALSGQTGAFVAIAVALVQVLKAFPVVAKKPKQVELIIQLALFGFATVVRLIGYEVHFESALPFIEAASGFAQQILTYILPAAAPGAVVFLASNYVAPIVYDKMHIAGTPGFESSSSKEEVRRAA